MVSKPAHKRKRGTHTEDFCAEKISDQETLKIIREFDQEHNFIIDPHNATGIGAAKKIQNTLFFYKY